MQLKNTLSHAGDHLNFLHNISWDNYQNLIIMRGAVPTPRINYLQSEVEFMSPSMLHEDIKSKIGRLIDLA